MKNKLLALLALACFGVGAAQADTLNFDAFGTDDLHTTTLVMPNATVTGFGDSLFNVTGFAAGGTICSFMTAFTCEADLRIDFNSAVSGLTFGVYGYDQGDFVTITAYAGLSSLGSVNVAADAQVADFSSFSGITRLDFDDASTGHGYSYGNFSFVAAVPEPETWGLLLGGLGLVGLMARRRRLPHHSPAAV